MRHRSCVHWCLSAVRAVPASLSPFQVPVVAAQFLSLGISALTFRRLMSMLMEANFASLHSVLAIVAVFSGSVLLCHGARGVQYR